MWTSTVMDFFLDKLPTDDMRWSVRDLLDFSYVPGINETYEGTWTNSDPPLDNDTTLGLSWLETEDVNNNSMVDIPGISTD